MKIGREIKRERRELEREKKKEKWYCGVKKNVYVGFKKRACCYNISCQ